MQCAPPQVPHLCLPRRSGGCRKNADPPDCRFPTNSSNPSPLASFVTRICSGLRLAYPADAGSAVILHTMLPKSPVSDGSRPAAANSSGHAGSNVRRPSPIAAARWPRTNRRADSPLLMVEGGGHRFPPNQRGLPPTLAAVVRDMNSLVHPQFVPAASVSEIDCRPRGIRTPDPRFWKPFHPILLTCWKDDGKPCNPF
jgi:hypothetical protein